MDFDPNAATGERKRSGPRWYSRVAFFVIALLLLLNAVAMFANAEANSEQACWAKWTARAETMQASDSQWIGEDGVLSILRQMNEECTQTDD